jgi:hypothetical protein
MQSCSIESVSNAASNADATQELASEAFDTPAEGDSMKAQRIASSIKGVARTGGGNGKAASKTNDQQTRVQSASEPNNGRSIWSD